MSALIGWDANGWILVKSDVGNFFESLNVIYVCASINKSHYRANEYTNVEIIFLHTVCHNSDVVQCILFIFRE
jgi:hypothetical protein